MLKIERQNIIDQEINKQGFVLVPAMSEMLKCSEETIRAAVASVVPARKKDKLAGNLRALELGIEA